MTLVRKLFWFALFLAFTLGFVTLFDHGFVTTKQFTADAKSELHAAVQLWQHPAKPGKSENDKGDEASK